MEIKNSRDAVQVLLDVANTSQNAIARKVGQTRQWLNAKIAREGITMEDFVELAVAADIECVLTKGNDTGLKVNKSPTVKAADYFGILEELGIDAKIAKVEKRKTLAGNNIPEVFGVVLTDAMLMSAHEETWAGKFVALYRDQLGCYFVAVYDVDRCTYRVTAISNEEALEHLEKYGAAV